MASYRDQKLECSACGKGFFFTVTEQRRLEQQGKEIQPPALCALCRQTDEVSGKRRGQIKWFRSDKGYGFIQSGGEELFFHRSRVLESDPSKLTDGAEVLFQVESGEKGPEAGEVELADDASEGAGE